MWERMARQDSATLTKRLLLAPLLLLFCTGCQMSYYLHSAYNQSKLISAREPIEKVLRQSSVSEETKRKLLLIQEAKAFAENDLGLKSSRNYTTFVKLDDPYVTYIVQVAYADDLKPYLWSFPLVGKVPYKGYFKKSYAEDEAASFDREKYDTYVRGVSAYSTLGWFQDSVLSTMLRYEDHDLVELILHETVHTTLYISSAAEFNERMATFLGEAGMKLFYLKKEGRDSPRLAKAEKDSADQRIFSVFITREIESLKKWYGEHKGFNPEQKRARLKEIQTHFSTEVRPKIQADGYKDFEKRVLNNAYLLGLQTYMYSLEDFQKLFEHFGGDFRKTMEYLKGLESDPHPEKTLRDFIGATRAS